MTAGKTLWAGATAAVGASLCCVAPLVLVTLGIGGAWMTTLTALEPLRPVFVVLTLGLLALAWKRIYRPAAASSAACEPGAVCANGTIQRRQKLIFWSVSALLLLLLAFPWYAPIFY